MLHAMWLGEITIRHRQVLSQRNWVTPSARHCRRSQPRGRALHRAGHGHDERGHGIREHGSWQRELTAVLKLTRNSFLCLIKRNVYAVTC